MHPRPEKRGTYRNSRNQFVSVSRPPPRQIKEKPRQRISKSQDSDVWASIVARWRISAGRLSKKRLPRVVRRMRRALSAGYAITEAEDGEQALAEELPMLTSAAKAIFEHYGFSFLIKPTS